MSEHIVHITDGSFADDVLQSATPVLLDFWAEWCGPCKMIAPILDDIAKEYAGKLNFYLSAVDSLLKRDDDQPTIGLLLCRDKNNVEVEFALRDMNKPMGVSEYTLLETLPDNLKGALPTVEEIELDLQQLQEGMGE